MRRRAWIGPAVVAAIVVGGFVVIRPPATLSIEDTDAFHTDLRQFVTIVYDSPAGVAQWRKRCKGALKPPNTRQRAALADIVTLVRSRPDHLLVVDGNRPQPTVRDVVIYQANDLRQCRAEVATIPPAWRDVEHELRAAASGR